MFWNVQFSLAPPVQVQPPISRKNACIKARNPLDRAQNLPRTKRSHSAHCVPLTTNPPLAPVKRAKGVRGPWHPCHRGQTRESGKEKSTVHHTAHFATLCNSLRGFAASREPNRMPRRTEYEKRPPPKRGLTSYSYSVKRYSYSYSKTASRAAALYAFLRAFAASRETNTLQVD